MLAPWGGHTRDARSMGKGAQDAHSLDGSDIITLWGSIECSLRKHEILPIGEEEQDTHSLGRKNKMLTPWERKNKMLTP